MSQNVLLLLFLISFRSACFQKYPTKVNSETDDKTDSLNVEKEKEVVSDETNGQIENFEAFDFCFSSANEQADSLIYFMMKAKGADSLNKIWEMKFFRCFPNAFTAMDSIFGYHKIKGAGPLYNYPVGNDVLLFFSKLQHVPDSIFYDKYIRINIGGGWEADNIRDAFYFGFRLRDDAEQACKSIEHFSDRELKSVFRFIFDGPHPDTKHNAEIYKQLKETLDNHNTRLANLLKQSYDQLIDEGDWH